MRPSTERSYARLCGARPMPLFEGSRPWGGIQANSMASACYLGLAVDLEKVVIVFIKRSMGACVVNRANNWINAPVRFLGGANGKFGSMIGGIRETGDPR